MKGTIRERLVAPPAARKRGCRGDNGVNGKDRPIARVEKGEIQNNHKARYSREDRNRRIRGERASTNDTEEVRATDLDIESAMFRGLRISQRLPLRSA